MHGIESLDFNRSVAALRNNTSIFNSLSLALPYIVPNLLELKFSPRFDVDDHVIKSFSDQCPHLEKIRYKGKHICGRGRHLKNSANTLKSINMDDSTFNCPDATQGMFDLNDNNHQTILFLLHECCKSLARLSIRNAKYTTNRGRYYENGPPSIPQGALIKFIRNAPSTLKWFRSDLTQENINVLQMEHPGIEFLN